MYEASYGLHSFSTISHKTMATLELLASTHTHTHTATTWYLLIKLNEKILLAKSLIHMGGREERERQRDRV